MLKRLARWIDPVPHEHAFLRAEFDLQTAAQLLDIVVPLGRLAGIAYAGVVFVDIFVYSRVLPVLLPLRLALCLPFFLMFLLRRWRDDATAVFRGLFFLVILGSIPAGFMIVVTGDYTGPFSLYFMLIIMFMGTLPWPAGWVLPINGVLLGVYTAAALVSGSARAPALFLTYVYCLLGCVVAVLLMQRELMRLRWVSYSHERQMRSLNATLESDLETQRRLAADLAEARQAAEGANRAKSTFLATMSHEIRTPMNAIIGMSGILMDTELRTDQRESVEIIRTSGDALLALINDILDFSKIEAGKMDLEEQPFGLRECLESSLDLVVAPAGAKDLELGLFMEPGLPSTIVGDVTRLRQVLINLLSNAVKFTERGSVVLSVASGGPEDGAGLGKRHLRFIVRDTGIGFSPDRQGVLFQPFSQADASTSRRFGGTGLGLAICKRLVELMGGSIGGQSLGPGSGSSFSFIVPFGVAEEARHDGASEPDSEVLAGKRLLVCESSEIHGEMIASTLLGWGARVKRVATVEEATVLLAGPEAWDAAFIDLSLSAGEGDGAVGSIRRTPGGARLPLIGIVPFGHAESPVAQAGVLSVVPRPAKGSQLFDALVRVLRPEKLQEAGPSHAAAAIQPGMAQAFPLRILVAEDNPINQKIAQRLLLQLGYRADLAANGIEVLQALDRQPYDVVFMDVQMPELDGLETTRRIRERWRRGGPSVIAMTAEAMSGDRERCLEAGMDDYLSKPLRSAELASKLKGCGFARQTSGPPAGGPP